MSAARAPLAAALERWNLNEPQLESLEKMLDVLARDEHAPTAVRARREAIDAHLADSLVGLDIDGLRRASDVADLGVGAGFPGLALAVALPDTRFSLVESQRRKCEFVERLRAIADLEKVSVVCARAEQWEEGRGANDAVLARALAPQPVVLEYAAPLLKLGGVLVDWRGRRDQGQESAAVLAAEQLGMRLLEIRRVQPFAAATDRHLHVFVKEAETPQRFPRRAGMARKRPLGG
jgi:16S rRNA (guanine527-N7)-methyltransferase